MMPIGKKNGILHYSQIKSRQPMSVLIALPRDFLCRRSWWSHLQDEPSKAEEPA